MERPANNPDCNPKEKVLGLIKARIHQTNIATKGGLILGRERRYNNLKAEYDKKLAQN